MNAIFHNLCSSSDKNEWNASDIIRLSREMGEAVSERQAAAMVDCLSSDSNGTVVTMDDFARFWSPPEP